jgi:hypothetical protein
LKLSSELRFSVIFLRLKKLMMLAFIKVPTLTGFRRPLFIAPGDETLTNARMLLDAENHCEKCHKEKSYKQ